MRKAGTRRARAAEAPPSTAKQQQCNSNMIRMIRARIITSIMSIMKMTTTAAPSPLRWTTAMAWFSGREERQERDKEEMKNVKEKKRKHKNNMEQRRTVTKENRKRRKAEKKRNEEDLCLRVYNREFQAGSLLFCRV